jgi:aryl-alcohol dehydrogenase-like predicted oxidoreductase
MITNQLIREALRPYPENLVIVTKLGARSAARTAPGTLRWRR